MSRPAAPPPHLLSLLQGEFVWDGKYDAHGRRREPVLPPWPVVPEPREVWGGAASQSPAPAPALAPESAPSAQALPPDGNVLLAGDNLLALAALLPRFREQVQLIYIDPPFDTGADQTMRIPLGEGHGHRQGTQGGDALRLVAYRDAWGSGAESYLQRMYERLRLMRELLRPSGVLCLHCDWRSHAPLRMILDEVFGPERFLNEIVWHYYNKYSAATRCLPRAHDTILMYARGAQPALNPLRLPRETPARQLVRENVGGVLRNARDGEGRLRYRTVQDRKGDDVWRIPQLQPASREWSGYSTQKHPALLERLIALTSSEGDLVADFFCGAGTALTVAERMGRRWIGCDQGALAVQIARKRLLRERAPATGQPARPERPGQPPFRLVTLDAAARRWWYEQEFGADAAACRREVLRALGAEPAAPNALSDPAAAQGALDGALCAMPELDAACTAEHAQAAVALGAARGADRVYLLAWEFEPRLWARIEPWLTASGVELVPLLIPRALATAAGSAPPTFRALPRLKARLETVPSGEGHLVAALQAYSPGSSRAAWSKQWEQPPEPPSAGPSVRPRDPLAWLDGWSVDAAWRHGQPFRHGWWDFRTPHQRALASRSAPLVSDGGQPCILTCDVWGLSTLHALDWPPRRP